MSSIGSPLAMCDHSGVPGMSQSLASSSRKGSSSPMNRDVHCAPSDSLPVLLADLQISVLISTYQTGHLVVVSAPQNRLSVAFHQFERAMGIAVKPGTIAVCTRKEVWFLREASDIAAKLPPAGSYDACYLARTAHFTDDIHAHESAWIGNEFWIVNTRFSCLCALHPHYSFTPRWKPPFISALRPDDRCHLNGLAVVDGQPRYVTALGETDTPAGWRLTKNNGGCLIEMPGGRLIARGLSLPHSPRFFRNHIYLLESGTGDLLSVDPATGQATTIVRLPGVIRGLAIFDRYAFVGLSRARPSLEGVPIVENRDSLKCGVWVIDLDSGSIVAHLEFASGVEEVFDVQVLPGITNPYLSGPSADQDVGQPLWTVPPG